MHTPIENKFIDLSKGPLVQKPERRSAQGRKTNQTGESVKGESVNLSFSQLGNPKEENHLLVSKIEKMVGSSKRLDESVLIKLDDIFNHLIDKNTLFRSSIEKLKCFISQVLQSVLEKLVVQQEGL